MQQVRANLAAGARQGMQRVQVDRVRDLRDDPFFPQSPGYIPGRDSSERARALEEGKGEGGGEKREAMIGGCYG